MIPSLSNKYEHCEVMPVVLSSGEEIKLLSVPNFQLGDEERAGKIIGRLTYDLINDWKSSNNVVSMVFDTTSSNTGQWSGGCKLNNFEQIAKASSLECMPETCG